MDKFELVQVHECGGHAEIVVRSKTGVKVYAGNLPLSDIPTDFYPPDYGFKKDDNSKS